MSGLIGNQGTQRIGSNSGVFTTNELIALDSLGKYNTSKIVATGGTIATRTHLDYTIKRHTFTGNGTFQITSGRGTVYYFVCAGGGGAGGGFSGSGGGGAGGVLRGEMELGPGSYTVTVGAAGANAPSNNGYYGYRGGSSVFHNITATGGGGGGSGTYTGVIATNSDQRNGGSGGGRGNWGSVGGTGTSGQGSDGGNQGNGMNGGGGGKESAGGAGTGGNGTNWFLLTDSIFAQGGPGGDNDGQNSTGHVGNHVRSGNNSGVGGKGSAAEKGIGGDGYSGIVILGYEA